MKLTLRHQFECTAEAFWAAYFDSDTTTRLHREGLGSTSVEIVSVDGDLATGLTRTLRYGQRPDAPGPVRKLFGDEIITTEVATFDPATSTSSFKLTPGTMADKTDLKGSVHLEDHGDGTSTQTFELEARVRIFGVGPVVERFIEHQAHDTQNKAVAFIKGVVESG